ncbi:hypothetical protein HPP92_006380 [Vanilla planifolia]|uniref:Uncharacterized protein n=1 Tax=Vanilla planifolia TaxID=51239 RepID=A0A835V8M6_VANPL|nr:hypothetical protein HPP92_006380 [Vanilla planifolia]
MAGELKIEDREEMIDTDGQDYVDPPPAPMFDAEEFRSWSFYRAGLAEFVATFLFVYVSVLAVMGAKRGHGLCSGIGIQGISWAFGGSIFVLVHCTSDLSGGHINPAVTFGLALARKLTVTRAVFYVAMQCLGAMCAAAVVKRFQGKDNYELLGGGANSVSPGYSKGAGLLAELMGTFVLVYTVFTATDPKRRARDPHISVLAPLAIGFSVAMVHLATIPVTGTGINPARSLGTAILYNKAKPWHDQWVFWVGPLVGAGLAALYHEIVIRALPFKSLR